MKCQTAHRCHLFTGINKTHTRINCVIHMSCVPGMGLSFSSDLVNEGKGRSYTRYLNIDLHFLSLRILQANLAWKNQVKVCYWMLGTNSDSSLANLHITSIILWFPVSAQTDRTTVHSLLIAATISSVSRHSSSSRLLNQLLTNVEFNQLDKTTLFMCFD